MLTADRGVAMGQASFRGLGWLPSSAESMAFDVSGDGTAVVGGRPSFIWTEAGGMTRLGGEQALAVSYDGSIVVGITSFSNTQAYRWTESGGYVVLGDLPGGDLEGWAYGVSADGSIVVGMGSTDTGQEAWRWTESTGMVSLGRMNGQDTAALDISADGSTIVGYSTSSAWRWTQGAGYQSIGSGRAQAISADGTTIVGRTAGLLAMIWTESTGQQVIGRLPGFTYGDFRDVSADGRIAVGASHMSGSNPESMIWDAQRGLRSLEDELTTVYGVDLMGWQLGWTWGISDDGTTIVGMGYDQTLRLQAWCAVIPEPATLCLLALGAAGMSAARRRGVRLRRPSRTASGE